MMDSIKLTQLAQLTLAKAVDTAKEFKHAEVNGIHLLRTFITEDGPAKEILSKMANLDYLEEEVQQVLMDYPVLETTQMPQMSEGLGKVIQKSTSLAKEYNDEYIAQEMLLWGLLETDTSLSSVFTNNNISIEQVKKEVDSMRQHEPVTQPNQETSYKALEKYTTDFTALAKAGKLDPVIGRDSEIRRVMQVLSRRTKNNPVLIGEPGVGKTAIVEGLAQRMISGDVPDSLKHKVLLGLEMASLLAGAKYRGEFEERLKMIIDQIHKQEGKIILFIDELHTVVGAGGSEGAVDASNMLKPGLARGILRVIGATTLNEYRQNIEKDAALERRFQPVLVNPPSVTDSISILRGLKEKYEAHHGIQIRDEALIAAAELSDRYITDRFLPDKAIDLVDEAASGLKIQAESLPEELDSLNREITQIEIELKALAKEKNEGVKDKRDKLQKRLEELREQQKTLQSRWESQHKLLANLGNMRNELDQKRAALERAEREVNLDVAAKIKYGDLPQLKQSIEDLQKDWEEIPETDRLVKQEVGAEDIAMVVSKWTGIPVTKLLKTESEKLIGLEDELGKRVIGQKVAVEAVAKAIRRSRSGLSEENRPLAIFMFMGPTGVGKTETAKALAEILFNDDKAIIRLDMSEYSQEHNVARLVGAPPGYVGYDQGGQLTEAVRRKPYSVVLLDEFEKAHSRVFNMFLQIFDEGRLTDGMGRTVNFSNTILIMTSNLGSNLIQEAGEEIDNRTIEKVWDLLRETYTPEFINRIDQLIMFEPLNKDELKQIVLLQLKLFEQKLKKKKIGIEFDEAVVEYLAKVGYDPLYGARPLKRLIQSEIIDPLALKILETELDIKNLSVRMKNEVIEIATS